MYVSKHGGGNRVAIVEEFAELGSSNRQQVTSFIEGFLQREHVGPELCDELVQTLRKLGVGADENTEDALSEAVLMLSRAGETREMHAAGHGEAVGRLADAIGRALDLTHQELKDLVFAARVHDVGKILIPERILNKDGPLTGEESALLKMHAPLGAQIVGAIPGGARMQQFIRHHHERYDGDGYPERLAGEQIPLGARIIGVAEAFANMTLDRPYASAMTPEMAGAELERHAGKQFDAKIVRALLLATHSERAATHGA
jgi:HD-GYP domain-containing protein (c-di-GMP phosphodiesterase class II)